MCSLHIHRLCWPCLWWWGRLCRRRCAAGGCARAVLVWEASLGGKHITHHRLWTLLVQRYCERSQSHSRISSLGVNISLIIVCGLFLSNATASDPKANLGSVHCARVLFAYSPSVNTSCVTLLRAPLRLCSCALCIFTVWELFFSNATASAPIIGRSVPP